MRPTNVTAVDLNPAWPRDSSTTGHATPRGQWLQWKPPREASPPQYSHEGGGGDHTLWRSPLVCTLSSAWAILLRGQSQRHFSSARDVSFCCRGHCMSETSGGDSLLQEKRVRMKRQFYYSVLVTTRKYPSININLDSLLSNNFFHLSATVTRAPSNYYNLGMISRWYNTKRTVVS